MINAETKDYLVDYLISQQDNLFTFDYSEIDQTKLSSSECDLLLDYFSDIDIIDSRTAYKQGPLKIKKRVELYDLKNAGGFIRKEKINEAEIEKLFGDLTKLQKLHPELDLIGNVISSLSGVISIFK